MEEKDKFSTSIVETQQKLSQATQLLKTAQAALATADKESTHWKEQNAFAQTQLLQAKSKVSRAKESLLTSVEGKRLLTDYWLTQRKTYLLFEDFQKLLVSFIHRLLSKGFNGCLTRVEKKLFVPRDPEHPSFRQMVDEMPNMNDLLWERVVKISCEPNPGRRFHECSNYPLVGRLNAVEAELLE